MRPQYQDRTPSEYFEKIAQVNRVSKKGSGGDKRSLSVVVVVGDRKGKVGVGLGKAADIQSAVRKATAYAKRHMETIPLKDNRTIPHEILIKRGAAKVLLKPAPEGTGVIAGGSVRMVVEAAGIKDIVSKTLGTKNQASNVYAALEGLTKLKVASNTPSRDVKVKVAEVKEKTDDKNKKVKKVKETEDEA